MEIVASAPMTSGVTRTFEKSRMTLTVTGDKGFVETYDMCKEPDATSSLVSYYRGQALQQLSLDTLTKDLARSANLMYLAYAGVKGTELAASVSDRQIALGDLCTDCVTTMTIMRDNTRAIIKRVIKGFKSLLNEDDDETEALDILANCATYATAMATQCGILATGFGKLKEDTTKDCSAAEKQIFAQVQKLAELTKLRNTMSGTLARQQEITKNIARLLSDLETEIKKAEMTEEKESDRAFAMAIISSVTSAVATAASAFVAIKTDPMGVKSMVQSQNALKPENDPKVAKAKKEKEDKEKEIKDKEIEETAAKKELQEKETAKTAAANDVAIAEIEKDRKEAELAAAAADKKQAIQDNIAILKQELIDKNKALKDAEEAVRKATERANNVKTALTVLAAGLNTLSDKVTDMSKAAENRADKARDLRLDLLSQKRELEDSRQDALGQVAELTSNLKANETSSKVEESTQYALEMAKWAFDNIYVALSNAKLFWENMARFCKKLADSDLREDIERAAKKVKKTRAERIEEYFLDEDFVSGAIVYVANWKALEVVSAEYVDKSFDVRGIVMANIGIKSLTIAEAREKLETLKKEIMDELAADKKINDAHIADIKELQKTLGDLKKT